MNTQKTTDLFFAGIPTRPDVDKLREAFGVPSVGVFISYAQIAAIINTSRESSRYKTVTTAWRRALLREHNILFEAVAGDGFRVMSSADKVHFGSKKIKSGVKQIKYAGNIVAHVPLNELSPDDQRVATKVKEIAVAINLAAVTTAKQIDYTKALAPVKR